MRKDITIEKIMLGGGKINKSELARQYGCCWRTIDKRLNPGKYLKERKVRIYNSILDPYKNIIDEKIENNLHYYLDMVFKEDENSSFVKNTQKN